MEFLGTFQGILTTIAVAAASIFGSYFVFRGKRGETQVQAAQVKTESTAKFLDGQMEFQKYVDEVVRTQVEEATAEMRTEIADLATKLASVKSEYHDMTDAIRSRETRLWLWNNVHERQGEMPPLPENIMHRLSLGHLINLSMFAEGGKMATTPTEE